MYGTKEVEKMLAIPLDNWIRYGRMKDWMPSGFKCALGMMVKIKERETDGPKDEIPMPIDEAMAVRFEVMVNNLPARHRQAFVMHQLGRFAEEHRIIRVRSREESARRMGVNMRQWHYLVNQACNMAMTRWRG